MVYPMDYRCPTCDAGPDKRCGDANGEFYADECHAARVALAEEENYNRNL